MEVSANQVKELRFKTGAGIMQCKEALAASNGSIEEAAKWLREKGVAAAAKRSGRAAKEGLVHAYIHPGGKVGVLIELNCETDFAARNDLFQKLVKDLAMHVAASNPLYVAREAVPDSAIEEEKDILRKQAENEGKPAQIIEKIVTGRVDKFYAQVCLLEQPFVKDMNKTVQDLITEAVATIGENIVVRRFARFQLGAD